jgi:adenylate kinase
MSSTIFVGGVHGAGKTTFAKQLAVLLDASHVTAGGLIRENAGATHTVTVGFGDKAVPDVGANQLLLLRGLDLYRRRVGPRLVLLDGHFVLLGANGTIAEIPLAVYRTIGPQAVVLVEAEAAMVRARLVARDGEAPPVATLAELAARERLHAEHVCSQLGVPLLAVAGSGDPDQEAAAAAGQLEAMLGGAA